MHIQIIMYNVIALYSAKFFQSRNWWIIYYKVLAVKLWQIYSSLFMVENIGEYLAMPYIHFLELVSWARLFLLCKTLVTAVWLSASMERLLIYHFVYCRFVSNYWCPQGIATVYDSPLYYFKWNYSAPFILLLHMYAIAIQYDLLHATN